MAKYSVIVEGYKEYMETMELINKANFKIRIFFDTLAEFPEQKKSFPLVKKQII